MAQVRLNHIAKQFDGQSVLADINIDIRDGEFMVFVGPSGCGKSTLLRTIAGLERATSGQVLIGSDEVTHAPPARRGVAMVFQSYALYPHMTVFDNIAFGLKLAKKPREEVERAVHAAAELLQIEHLLGRKPAALSGGQRQRVAIGRSIVREPRVFLFDEPLSNLDAALRVQMRVELIKLHRRLGTTVVYVTHDQVEAMTMADRIAVLNQGRLEQLGTPLELYRRPNNMFVAGFIGSPKMNFLDVSVTAVDEGGVTVRLPGEVSLKMPVAGENVAPGDELKFGVRPEHVGLKAAVEGLVDATVSGEVVVVEHLGGEILVHLQIAGESTVELKSPGTHDEVSCGDRLDIVLNADLCHLFNLEGQALTRTCG
jgi:multiple sugar transport system ATP-binding protein